MAQGITLVGLQGVVHVVAPGTTRLTWAATSSNNIYVGAAPQTMTAMNVVKNVNLELTVNEADVSTRASLWKLTAMALQDAALELEIPWTPTDSGFQVLRQSFFGRASVALAILDGSAASSGSQGLWADFVVVKFPREEPLEKEMMTKVSLKPAATAVPPQWVQVS